MKLLRLSALRGPLPIVWTGCLGVFQSLVIVACVHAQSPSDPLTHEAVFPAVMFPEVSPRQRWAIDGEFLALRRNDEHSIIFDDGGNRHTVELQSDSVAGVRLGVSRSAGMIERQVESPVWAGGFLFAEDENRYSIATEEWEITSRLLTAELNVGLESNIFGVRTMLMAGARYAYVTDEYDSYLGPGIPLTDDFVRSSNHAVFAQGKFIAIWEHGRWALEASLGGGAGVNQSHQKGTELSSSSVLAYDSDQASITTIGEVLVSGHVRVLSKTSLHVGIYGLSMSEMAVSRRGLGTLGDLDDARYFGLTMGVQQCF